MRLERQTQSCCVTHPSRACNYVAVKSTLIKVYGDVYYLIGRPYHFLVSPSGRQRLTGIGYDFSLQCHLPSPVCFLRLNAAKVMCSTIAVCVEAGGLAVSTKRW